MPKICCHNCGRLQPDDAVNSGEAPKCCECGETLRLPKPAPAAEAAGVAPPAAPILDFLPPPDPRPADPVPPASGTSGVQVRHGAEDVILRQTCGDRLRHG